MMLHRRIFRDEGGAAAVEMAFVLPILVAMIWIFAQLGQIYRASAGMQMALGQGARFATLCVNPTVSGCTSPSDTDVQTRMKESFYGKSIGGTFDAPKPNTGNDGTSRYYDLKVTYEQPTSLLFVPGPTIKMSRSKRVWIAAPVVKAS